MQKGQTKLGIKAFPELADDVLFRLWRTERENLKALVKKITGLGKELLERLEQHPNKTIHVDGVTVTLAEKMLSKLDVEPVVDSLALEESKPLLRKIVPSITRKIGKDLSKAFPAQAGPLEKCRHEDPTGTFRIKTKRIKPGRPKKVK